MWETWVRSLGWEDPLEKGKLPTHFLVWRIPCTVLSMGLQRVRHNWATFTVKNISETMCFSYGSTSGSQNVRLDHNYCYWVYQLIEVIVTESYHSLIISGVGTSVLVQWLGLCASNAEWSGLIPSHGTKTPHACGTTKNIFLLLLFRLCWVFLALQACLYLWLIRGYSLAWCMGFSLQWLLL